MNYLAHAYLSFGHPQILVGNMISDYVKGRQQYHYPQLILKGIKLHRSIDQFTDVHTAVAGAKEIFRPYYRLYASPIIDVVFDHFVARHAFTQKELHVFAQDVYQTLEAHSTYLPERFLQFLPYMKTQNWLYHYSQHWGIERSLQGLVRRSAYLSESAVAFQLFQQHYDELQQQFHLFFEDVKTFAKAQMADILL